MSTWIKNVVETVIKEKKYLLDSLESSGYLIGVEKIGHEISNSIGNGGKIMIAGNGGSAADAQHFAGEIVGRFMMEREGLPAISLCTDSSVITAIGNDYGYDDIFARQVSSIGKENDFFIGISTSGNSKNIIKAIEAAKKKHIKTVGLLGNDGGMMKDICDTYLVVHSNSTPRIQEVHGFTVHLLCEIIEKDIFGN